MNVRLKQLRDLVVALDRADRKLQPMTPDAYRAAASRALSLTREEMGLLPIGDFAGPVNALQNMAENIFFGVNGCFADIDGSGRAPVAATATNAFLGRMRASSGEAVRDVSESLFERLRSPASRRGRRTAGTQG